MIKRRRDAGRAGTAKMNYRNRTKGGGVFLNAPRAVPPLEKEFTNNIRYGHGAPAYQPSMLTNWEWFTSF